MQKGNPGNQAALKTKLLGKLYMVGSIMLLAWVPLAAVTVFHHDFLGIDSKPSDSKTQAYLWLAIVVNAAGPFLMWGIHRRMKTLASTGVRTIATIVKVSAVSSNDIRPVTYSFQVGPLTYTVKRDTPEILLKGITKTRQVPVIYDPANPNSCELLFPNHPETFARPETSERQSIWHKLLAKSIPKSLLLLVATGALLLAAAITKALGAEVGAYGAMIVVIALLAAVCADIGWTILGDRNNRENFGIEPGT
jgi:hypothetical protein